MRVFDTIKNARRLEPIDRIALPLILLLGLLVGLLLCGGDRTRPYVRDFSWQNKAIGAADTFFVLTFSRPMDRASVETNLHIAPPLPGLVSWAGRRLVYTLTTPARYETTYQVELQKVRQRIGSGKSGNFIQPFVGQFRTRDRAFVYIGIEGKEKGRLVLYNLTHQQKTLLTPKNWVVTDFKPYPTGDRILFAASDWSNYGPGLLEQQLYTVTTDLSAESASSPERTSNTGKIEQVLDNSDYQNLKFDLSPDGQAIVVQRVNRLNVDDAGLWVLRSNAAWQPLLKQAGGDFLIAPDSATLANTQGEGVSILPLAPQAQPLDFLPQFSQVLTFSRDGVQAAMVKSNSDATRSLFWVTNRGIEKELIRISGEFVDGEFDPSGQKLYCLMDRVMENEQQLAVAVIDLKTLKVEPLIVFPKQRGDIEMSLSPDGLVLLFDRVSIKQTLPANDDLTTSAGSAIASSRLWLLPLEEKTSKFANPTPQQELPLQGFHPHWLP